MFRHVVSFKWRADMPADQVAAITAGLRSLPPEIGAIRSYSCGPDLGLGQGRWDFAVVADFDDADAWRTYDAHPTHERVRSEMILPWVAERATVQFEI
jgi:hypothetical protein